LALFAAVPLKAMHISVTPQQVQFKKESLLYFFTTGGPSGFLKPEEDKRSEAQKRVDQLVLRKAATYVGVIAKQRKEAVDVLTVRSVYTESPIPQSIETHLDILQIIVSSAIHGTPAQIEANRAEAEKDVKDAPGISHFVFRKYSVSQINDILTPNFEEWTERYQSLCDILDNIDPGLRFQALPLKDAFPDTVTRFSLKNGKVTWQESTKTDLIENNERILPQTALSPIRHVKKSKINIFFQGQCLPGNKGLILEADEIRLSGIVASTHHFILLKPHQNERVPLRAILLRRLILQPYPVILSGHIDFNTTLDGTLIEELAVSGCSVLLGFSHV
jgi:hypothetical protein